MQPLDHVRGHRRRWVRLAPATTALMISASVQVHAQQTSPPGDDAPPMRTVNFFREFEQEYIKPTEPTLVEVGPAHYLAIEGSGPPEGEDFQKAMPALFGVGMTVRLMCQKELNLNFGIGVVDAQWWADEEKFESFLSAPREQWRWKVLMRVPAEVSKDMVARAVESVKARQPAGDQDEAAGTGSPLDRLKLETIEEGTCIQMLHTGPYEKEQPNIEWMHRLAREQGYELKGRHHEIYLNSPQTTPPQYLKTILRQPVARKQAEGNGQ